MVLALSTTVKHTVLCFLNKCVYISSYVAVVSTSKAPFHEKVHVVSDSLAKKFCKIFYQWEGSTFLCLVEVVQIYNSNISFTSVQTLGTATRALVAPFEDGSEFHDSKNVAQKIFDYHKSKIGLN